MIDNTVQNAKGEDLQICLFLSKGALLSPSNLTMAGKQVVMMVVDAGSSMDQMHSENASRLKLALQCIEITLQQKIYYNPTHEVGFGIFGDRQHDQYDDNLLQLHPISKPNSNLLKIMHKMCKARLDNQKLGGDIFRAIRRCISLLDNHKQKKAKKRIFLFTNGMGETHYNEQSIKSLAIAMRANDIRLNVIPIDFMQGYSIEENQVQTEIAHPQQLVNAQLLMDLKAEAEDNMQIFPDEIAIQLYKRFRKREVNPTAIYRGEFQVAPDLNINVETYKFIRRDKLKSLQKYDVNQPFIPQISKEKEITTKATYIVQGDETSTEIEKENQMNAYSYGPHLIPISAILESEAKFAENRNMRLLGFVNKTQIPRAALMSEVELVVPERTNLASRKFFTALVFSMISTNTYAIARYIPRNSKSGVTPRLVVLIPYRTVDRQGLYLMDLPTVQDVRDYPFNSLKPASDKQRELVKELVSHMQLYKRNDDSEIEQLKMENTFNPTHQYFYQTVFYRVNNQDGEIPPLNPLIAKYLTPELRIYEHNKALCNDIKKQFKFIRKELPKEKTAKKTLLWKEAIQNQMPIIQDRSLVSSEAGEDLKPHRLFNGEQQDDQNFDYSDPLRSFDRMLKNNKHDMVMNGLNSMVEYINYKLKEAVTDDVINNLVQCASHMRRGCEEQQEYSFWDDWLEKAQHNLHKKLYNRIIEEGFGFLKRNNEKLYKPKNLNIHMPPGEQFGELD